MESYMKISSAFPSKYLRAVDLPKDEDVKVTIDHVQIEDVAGNHDPDDERPVLFFQGKSRGLVLNKTNSNLIVGEYGDETDDWIGKPLLLYATETEFQGKRVPCIRVRIPKDAAQSQPGLAKTPAEGVRAEDVPF